MKNMNLVELREQLVELKENLEEARKLSYSDNALIREISLSNVSKLTKKIQEIKTLARFKGEELV
jgi:hypothetical protein